MTGYGVGIAILLLMLAVALARLLRVPPGGTGPWIAETRRGAKRFLTAHYAGWLVVVAAVAVPASLAFGLWQVFPVALGLLEYLEELPPDSDTARGVVIQLTAALALFGILGAIIVGAIRVWTNERQVAASERQTATIEQGHVTDRLTKAVEQLGAQKTVKRILYDADGTEVRDERNVPVTVETTEPNLEVRLGGIYALERIARDSERDHVTVMAILCAYIRENAPAARTGGERLTDSRGDEGSAADETFRFTSATLNERRRKLDERLNKIQPPRADIQAALDVIGRRQTKPYSPERADNNFIIDLRDVDLRRCKLRGREFDHAMLDNSRLDGADLSEVRMRKAFLSGACLDGAVLEGAKLQAADLSGAILTDAKAKQAHMQYVVFRSNPFAPAIPRNACLDFIDLTGAQLHNARLEGLEIRGANFNAAFLINARLTKTNFSYARMKSAKLNNALMYEVKILWSDISCVDFRGATLDGSDIVYCLVDGADFRGECNSIAGPLVGDKHTLLPENGAIKCHSCFEDQSRAEELAAVAVEEYIDEDSYHAVEVQDMVTRFKCDYEGRHETGTKLAYDAPYPPDHPLAPRK
jgi:uncharacterized protein YjbI with pentapeptide repeats